MKKIVEFFNREQNLLIHFCAAIIVIVFSFIFKLSKIEWLFIIFSIGFVITTELINSAIELATDNYTRKFNKLAMIAKDTAASAVVIAAINSVVVGIYVFLPKIMTIIK